MEGNESSSQLRLHRMGGSRISKKHGRIEETVPTRCSECERLASRYDTLIRQLLDSSITYQDSLKAWNASRIRNAKAGLSAAEFRCSNCMRLGQYTSPATV